MSNAIVINGDQRGLAAVVVARKGSKRIPDKLHQQIGGQGLVERKIAQLRRARHVDQIILGTDDERLRGMADSMGATFVLRPPEYCDEVSRSPNEMVQHMLSCFAADVVLWAHPTNPFIDGADYDEAISHFRIMGETCDGLFSATEMRGHFWTDWPAPINYDPRDAVHRVARDLPAVYAQNGGIFIRPHADMLADGRFVSRRPYMYRMDAVKGWDIDEPWQLAAARAMHGEG